MKLVFGSIFITSLIAFALPINFVLALTVIFLTSTLWFVYALIRFGVRIKDFRKLKQKPPFTLLAIFSVGLAGFTFGASLVGGAFLLKYMPLWAYQLLLTYSYSIAVSTFGVMAYHIEQEAKKAE